MKFLRLCIAVVSVILTMTGNSGAQAPFNGSPAVLQLRLEIEKGKEVVASAVLVHREDVARGVVLYFLTSETLLHPTSDAAPAWESEGESPTDDTTTSIAVLRILTEKSALVPAALTHDPLPEGAPFFIVSHTVPGVQIAIPQRVRKISTRQVIGDLEMPWPGGCVGAPAFTEKGVFGVVSECGAGRPTAITLVSAARDLLRRLIPGLHLGPEGSQTFGAANR